MPIKRQPNSDNVYIGSYIEPDLHAQFKSTAALRKLTLQQALGQAIHDYVTKKRTRKAAQRRSAI